MKKHDLIIIGGGAGGLSVASAAAQLGLSVSLIEREAHLGGDCLHTGCVPSKTFIHVAQRVHQWQQGAAVGLPVVSPSIDLARINAHVAQTIAHIQHHDDPDRFRSYGCDVLFGAARFLDAHRVQVNDTVLWGRRIVIAAGSQPWIPPIPGLENVPFLTNENFFQLPTVPEHLVIIGSGVIALELGQAMGRLGSRVTFLEVGAELLPHHDPKVRAYLLQQLQAEGFNLHFQSQVKHVSHNGEQHHLVVEPANGEAFSLTADQLLVAAGRQPNVQSLDLAAAEVAFSPKGIAVNAKLQTNQRHIYALGDVADQPFKFTHIAEYHAGIVISNAVFRWPKKLSTRVYPAVIFTDPQVATVGETAEQLEARGLTPTILEYDIAEADRAITDAQRAGFAKWVIYKGKVMGASIVGANAGELIAVVALMMQNNLPLSAISNTIHPYPTWSQINRRTANRFFADKLFSPTVRKVVKLINRWLP